MGAEGGVLEVALREADLVALVIDGEEAGQCTSVGGECKAVAHRDGGYLAALDADALRGI